ncbi:MAG: transcriptional regulator, partial [Brotaphodocola sp.]
MEELYRLGISGLGISVVEDREPVPQSLMDQANKLCLPLFFVRWEGASFVDISQCVGTLILETSVQNKRTGDYLYNLLFGYDINEKYVEKISGQ